MNESIDYNPLVTIIIASYGNSAYIEETLSSVVYQTYKHWEIVITDDASPDNSNEIIELFIKKYSRISLIKHKVNKGVGSAFKTCTENANGELIVMLGADDALKINAIESLVEIYKNNPNASMVIGAVQHTDIELNKINRVSYPPKLENGVSILEHGECQGWDTFRRASYNKTVGFNSWFPKAVDVDIELKLEEVDEIIFINEPYYLYRSNPLGVSRNNVTSKAWNYKFLGLLDAMKRRNVFYPKHYAGISHACFEVAFERYVFNKNIKVGKYFSMIGCGLKYGFKQRGLKIVPALRYFLYPIIPIDIFKMREQ